MIKYQDRECNILEYFSLPPLEHTKKMKRKHKTRAAFPQLASSFSFASVPDVAASQQSSQAGREGGKPRDGEKEPQQRNGAGGGSQ